MLANEDSCFKLIMACAAPALGQSQHKAIKGLASQITDWIAFCDLAAACRLSPAVFERLSRSDASDAIPAAELKRLKDAYFANMGKSAGMIQNLAKVMNALQMAGIEALTYKGPILANEAYDDPSVRQFDDLDIIVRKRDLQRARDSIEAEGYDPCLALPEAIERSPFRPEKPYLLRHRDGSHDIDLSCRLMHDYFSFELPEEAIWEGSRLYEVDQHSIPTLSREALFVTLCVHGSKHLWSRPSWIGDIAGLLSKNADSMDWEEIIRLARATDGLRMVLLGVSLAETFFAAPCPPILKRLLDEDPKVATLNRELCERLPDRAGKPEVDNMERLGLHLRMRQRYRTRLRYLLVRGITPSYNDWRALKLPRLLYPLYYLTRPFRLLLR